MRLLVNKFMLRHNGRLYKAGDSLELPDTLAVSLAEKSAGAYSLMDTKEEVTEDIAANNEETIEAVADVAEVLEKATTKVAAKPRIATRKSSGAKK